ncbi:hypothetical protein M404DRAFT_419467 [Pisolithus tinctorius Marx 270]|uniref:ribonuclease H n=1 Tax=Pisolithus tinctorius Marx 270 TaxID=870435 RepID=A0A0C3PG59_PISTI|nr:hypothetical protein M404DRAFT_419467 [Pisolithus tinctorius Marx 270]
MHAVPWDGLSAPSNHQPASSTSAAVARVAPSTGTPDADEKEFDVVYCDGACKGNGATGSKAGIGVWWGHNDPRNLSERCPGDQTNNRAELIAIVRILETTPPLKRKLLIKTDSQYSIRCRRISFHSDDMLIIPCRRNILDFQMDDQRIPHLRRTTGEKSSCTQVPRGIASRAAHNFSDRRVQARPRTCRT